MVFTQLWSPKNSRGLEHFPDDRMCWMRLVSCLIYSLLAFFCMLKIDVPGMENNIKCNSYLVWGLCTCSSANHIENMLLTLLHYVPTQPQHSQAEFVFMMEWASSVGPGLPHILSSRSAVTSSLPQSASSDLCCSTSTPTLTLPALDSRRDSEHLVSSHCPVL